MGRSRSTPGLLESRGKKTLEDTPVQDNGVARPRPMKASSTCSSPRGQREGHVRTSSYLSEQRSTCCHSSLRTSPAQTTGRHASSATAAGPQRAYPHSSSIVGRSPHPSATSSLHAQQHYQPPPSPLPQFLNLPPGSPQHAGTTFTLQGPHAFIPIPTGTPVLASRSSPYTDYTNVSPVSSSNEPTTVAPPTALYGTSPGNSSTAIGTGQTHLFVPGPLQTSGIHSGAHSPTVLGSATRDQEDLLNEIKRLRERLVTLETENATMSIKLSQSTWQVENRLAEIEMHISTKNQHQYSPQQPRAECPTDSEFASGSDSDERNRESII